MAKNDSRSLCRQQQAEEPSRNENHMHFPLPSVVLSAPNSIWRKAILLDQRTRLLVQPTAKRRLCSANRLVENADGERRTGTRERLHTLTAGIFLCWPALLNRFQRASSDD